ncbi:DUF4091 domain-containing protein [Fundicoccus culcitae]|uniref:DUF4091 domain-containing protein n=1 Tax=Fundicoccus culcitae TaxID=2969821 RepID=A0ABY5P945_9LACT|nr:DUF4091 domain-containing protein [Fundicoccus culcitae]UUX35274.1 DUF4091 domain-containing protein [Fundicoccus culcitae]
MKPYFTNVLDVILKNGPINNNSKTVPEYILQGEELNLQIVIPPIETDLDSYEIMYELNSEIKNYTNLYLVEFVKPKNIIDEQIDEDHIINSDNLYPDRLKKINLSGSIEIKKNEWTTFWLSIKSLDFYTKQDIKIIFNLTSFSKKEEITFKTKVIDKILPKSNIYHTEWLHTDSLCQYYNINPFSEEYWYVVENYIKLAYDHSQNMVLTPIFTPALDTEENEERQTIQLINVKKIKGEYFFDFSNLTKWSNMLKRIGIENIEFPPFFTQWGAKFTPKIIVSENGKDVKEFGWHVPYDSDSYRVFLRKFLPELDKWIVENGWINHAFIHISDEPNNDSVTNYQSGKKIISENLHNVKYIDALSEFIYYEQNLVDIPIVGTPSIDKFISEDVKNIWCYYCGVHNNKVSNRYVDQYPRRTQIIGLQMYRYDIKGFLHWGYNYWFTELSKKFIDSFENFGGEDELPAGDAFVVYPGPDYTVYPSIRLKLIFEAFQDIRICTLSEKYIGKDSVLRVINGKLPDLDFNTHGKILENLTDIRNELKLMLVDE